MYAVISSGGKQYRLTEGSVVEVERLAGEVGDQVVFDRVLMLGAEDGPVIGAPAIEEARVVGTIVDQTKSDKVIIFKFKRRKMHRKKTGHRQLVTRVKVDSILQGEAGEGGKKPESRKQAAKQSADEQAQSSDEQP